MASWEGAFTIRYTAHYIVKAVRSNTNTSDGLVQKTAPRDTSGSYGVMASAFGARPRSGEHDVPRLSWRGGVRRPHAGGAEAGPAPRPEPGPCVWVEGALREGNWGVCYMPSVLLRSPTAPGSGRAMVSPQKWRPLKTPASPSMVHVHYTNTRSLVERHGMNGSESVCSTPVGGLQQADALTRPHGPVCHVQ